MSEFTNGLTEAQIERLAILGEECGEIQQMVGKIIRHGYASYNPVLDPMAQIPNRVMLEKELGDLLWIVKLMDDAVDINFHIGNTSAELNTRIRRKQASAASYLHHQAASP
jgi:NTP pyrophosphatase (non-canonical NTP hydrolase)